MSFLRNRAGAILIGAIGLAIFAFLLNDAISFGTPFWAESQTEVGEVAGETIGIEEFRAKVEQNEANFRQQMGGNLNPQMSSYIVENTWNQTISEILLGKEVKRLGLEVGRTELNDMVSGKNPHPQVVQTFGNPQTGQIDRSQLNSFLSNLSTQPANSPIRSQWEQFLVSIKQDRLFQKYTNLVKNSIYVTSLEAREEHQNRNKLADFSYVNLEYASIPDNQVKLEDKDYQEYYDEHKNLFKNREETRTFEYVVFDASPTKADSAAIRTNIGRIAAEFRNTTNDSLFVSVNADTKAPISYMKKGQLDPALDSLVFSAPVGSVVGPVYSNNAFRVAKVLDVRMSPDSVQASHILINPATEGGLPKAKAKADSIANLIRNGASFAELATKFGTDASKDKGGDLGTFGRGAMIPAFEEAVFNGKPGDLKVVTSQFGVHVVRVVRQVGSSRVARVAVVDKAVASSNETQQAAYSKASSFLSTADDDKAFDEQVKKQKLNKLVAENVTASQSMVAGLDNPRELIRWAFQADQGDVSDRVFELENRYVVAKLTDVREKGILPLAKVKKDIEPMVRNLVKGRMLSERLSKAASGASNIQQVAQKVGKQAQPAQNIVFANPIIPGLGQENKVVGTVFGLQPRKLSNPIEGESGVFVVAVNSFSNPAPLTNTITLKEQIAESLRQRAQGSVFEVLKEKAEITDNRFRFF
ncbi:SurA N-terminal domain-containing protein [Pedobacter sp. SYSU D00535]|uniref:SurA N-terminal domain-containing protein n=1 Tax=Pedobacter sp. SYSU D00535 TaxID=2810308 RepID=UPI00351AB70C